jgi:hypothetical protein
MTIDRTAALEAIIDGLHADIAALERARQQDALVIDTLRDANRALATENDRMTLLFETVNRQCETSAAELHEAQQLLGALVRGAVAS